jgi:hypothetical protein
MLRYYFSSTSFTFVIPQVTDGDLGIYTVYTEKECYYTKILFLISPFIPSFWFPLSRMFFPHFCIRFVVIATICICIHITDDEPEKRNILNNFTTQSATLRVI